MNDQPSGQKPGSYDDILPCPFCDSLDLICDGMDWEDPSRMEYFFVLCGGCSAFGPWVASDIRGAWEAWSTRSRSPGLWRADRAGPVDWPIKNAKPVEVGRALPCPFCGNDHLRCDGPWKTVKVMWSICCVTCDASVRGSAQTEASAYEAWNRRTPHTGLKGAQA